MRASTFKPSYSTFGQLNSHIGLQLKIYTDTPIRSVYVASKLKTQAIITTYKKYRQSRTSINDNPLLTKNVDIHDYIILNDIALHLQRVLSHFAHTFFINDFQDLNFMSNTLKDEAVLIQEEIGKVKKYEKGKIKKVADFIHKVENDTSYVVINCCNINKYGSLRIWLDHMHRACDIHEVKYRYEHMGLSNNQYNEIIDTLKTKTDAIVYMLNTFLETLDGITDPYIRQYFVTLGLLPDEKVDGILNHKQRVQFLNKG